MFKKQLTGISIAVLLVILLFSLPKAVVDNQEKDENSVTQQAMASDAPFSEDHDDHEGHDHDHDGHDHEGHDHEGHDHDHSHASGAHMGELTAEDRQIAEHLQEKIGKSENKEKSAIFADSLAELYAHAYRYDSAAYYAEEALNYHKTLPRLYQAGAFSSEAFKFALEPKKQQLFSKKAENYLLQVIEQEPGQLEAKAKLGMIYVASENPMKGIKLLQEVLEKDPDHTEALFNMGILSVQSNQYAKAVERLERLTSLEPGHVQAQFYLAYSYLQLGRKAEAKARLLKVKELDQSPDVLAAVDEYLKNL